MLVSVVVFHPNEFKSRTSMNDFDAELYPLFTGLKEQNGALKTFISVGGWAAGGKIFSDMVSTATNRAVFIHSALQFMRTYGFDGIDIDWEYPAASDREGVAADTANFVSFLKELKVVLGSNYGISVTLPSSYWYLQGFDVVSMEPYVDWFNLMSYDIHGKWDGNSPYTQAIVQPHTNLTEIIEGLDLLWRNNIKPSKVVLGLAFYGRSFTLSDSSCNTPGCAFSGGGAAGPCTGTSGILSNAEIQDIISQYDLTPTLGKDAAVKYMTWDSDQWVSYDDDETLALKKDYANSHCLGGTMVWALDLDDPSTSTSVSNLQSTGLKLTGDDVDSNPTFALSKLSAITQQNNIGLVSYWTDCSSDPQCAAGFRLMTTGHGKIFDADTMAYTGDGCHGGGKGYTRALCVQSNVQLKDCSWFGKPKGCKQTCPPGYALIAQNTHIGGASTSCKAGHFSSFCCGSVITSGVQECESDIIPPFSNGIGITIRQSDSSVVEKYQGTSADDALVGTSEVCDYMLSGLAVMIGSPNYILNEMPGSWQIDRGLGVAAWSPVMNSNYPTASSIPRTTTTTDTMTTFTTTSSEKHVTCDGSRYPKACGHYSSVGGNNPSNAELVCPYDIYSSEGDTLSVKSYRASHISAWLLWVPNLVLEFNKCVRDEYPPKHFPRTTPAKRDVQLQMLEQILQLASAHGELFVPDNIEDFSPERVLINDGDVSRKATSRELWERLGIIECESADCLEEAAAMERET
ncbi:hypothetical protein E8E14_002478 [Neopestalotiopsis sp. 37M]|nr:hypothetical protein E8E14_002478 [Neopestalotiopsis sp. 37M]